MVVHEGNRTWVSVQNFRLIAEDAFACLDAPIARVIAPDIPGIPASATGEIYMPSVDKIVGTLEHTLDYVY